MSTSSLAREGAASLAPSRLRVLRLGSAGLGALLAIFLLTGASGLVYQVLWQRLLALTFGVSAYATATVLAAFMGGLALGGYAAGRVADRLARPLLWYGLAEVGVGCIALFTPALFVALQGAYRDLYLALGQEVAPLARFLLAIAVLLIPTSLMGASFPLVVKAALRSESEGGHAIGLLYAVNTLGALAGTLVAGFVLIGQFGVTISIAIAAACNVAAGAMAIALSRSARPQPLPAPRRSDDRSATDAPHSSAASPWLWAVLPTLLGVSGFCSLAYEVVWTRLLVLFLETTTYAFTVMLAAFLAGIAAGSMLVSPYLRRLRHGPLALAALQALVGAASLLSVQLVARMDSVIQALGAGAVAGRAAVGAMAALSFLAMFPPALFLGMSFPLAVALYTVARPTRDLAGEGTGRRLGSLYAANVFGAIFGALAAGFVLVPMLGTQRTLIALALLNWGIGGIVTLATGLPVRIRLGAMAASLAVVGSLGALAPAAYAHLLAERFPGDRVLWSEEGLETTVTITRAADRRISMYLNSHHQANDADWMVFFHRMLGHLPMLLHPDPREVLVVGLGGGATAGAATRYEHARVTVVELSRSVTRGAEWFRDVNYAVVEQPNVHLVVDDGRNHLLVSGRRYDVITADAIWPTHAGSTNLYSIEYYRLARAALNDGGLMLQWVNRDLPEEQHKLMMRTFMRVFPYVSLWFDGSLMVGSERPIDLSLPWLARTFDWPLSKAALQQVNIREPDDVARLFVMDRAGLEAYVGDGPILTDDRPYLEFFLGFTADSGPRQRPAGPAP